MVVRMYDHLLFVPHRGPEVYCDHVGDELQVCDAPQCDLIGDCAGEILAERVVESTQSGLVLQPAVRGCVEGYMGLRGWDEERNPIRKFDGLEPPLDIEEEFLREDCGLRELGCKPLCGETPIEEKASGEDNVTAVKEFSAQDSKLMFHGLSFG